MTRVNPTIHLAFRTSQALQNPAGPPTMAQLVTLQLGEMPAMKGSTRLMTAVAGRDGQRGSLERRQVSDMVLARSGTTSWCPRIEGQA